MKLRITIDGKAYEAEVEILEAAESAPEYPPYPPAPLRMSQPRFLCRRRRCKPREVKATKTNAAVQSQAW